MPALLLHKNGSWQKIGPTLAKKNLGKNFLFERFSGKFPQRMKRNKTTSRENNHNQEPMRGEFYLHQWMRMVLRESLCTSRWLYVYPPV